MVSEHGLQVLDAHPRARVRVADRLTAAEQRGEPIAAHMLEAPERREVGTPVCHTSDKAAGKTEHLTFVEWHGRVWGERGHGDDVPAARTAHPGPHLHPAAAGALSIQRG